MFIQIEQAIGLNNNPVSSNMTDRIPTGRYRVVSSGDRDVTPLIEANIVIYTEDPAGIRRYYYDKEYCNYITNDLQGLKLPDHVLLAKEIVKNVNAIAREKVLPAGCIEDLHVTDTYHHFTPTVGSANFAINTFIKLRHTDKTQAYLDERYACLEIDVLKIIKGMNTDIVTEENTEKLETITVGLFNLLNFDVFIFKSKALAKVTMDWIYSPN